MDIAMRKKWFGQLVGVVPAGSLQPTDYLVKADRNSQSSHAHPRRVLSLSSAAAAAAAAAAMSSHGPIGVHGWFSRLARSSL